MEHRQHFWYCDNTEKDLRVSKSNVLSIKSSSSKGISMAFSDLVVKPSDVEAHAQHGGDFYLLDLNLKLFLNCNL